MSAEYVRRSYGVPAKRGQRVTVAGRHGVIVSFPGTHIGVRFDGERVTSRCHPTWEVDYNPKPNGEMGGSAIVRTIQAATLLRDAGCPPTAEQFVNALDVAMLEPKSGGSRMATFPAAPAGFVACRVMQRGATLTHLVALDEHGSNGGRPTVCGLTRFDDVDSTGRPIPHTAGLSGWGMGNTGAVGPAIQQIKCADCYGRATSGGTAAEARAGR